MRSKHNRRSQIITEFLVQVHPRTVDWGGLDDFLWWLIHRKPKENFAPFARKINKLKGHRQ